MLGFINLVIILYSCNVDYDQSRIKVHQRKLYERFVFKKEKKSSFSQNGYLCDFIKCNV